MSTHTVNQPSITPTRKVSGGGVGGATGIVLVWAAEQFAGVELPEEVAGAFVLLLAFLAAYFTKERAGTAGQHREDQPPPAQEAVDADESPLG